MKKDKISMEEMFARGKKVREAKIYAPDGEEPFMRRRLELVGSNEDKNANILRVALTVEDFSKVKKYGKAMEMLDSLNENFKLCDDRFAVVNRTLKKNGSIALLSDGNGWTFAHEIARRGLYPAETLPSQVFELSDKNGTTVKDVLIMEGFWINDKEEASRIRQMLLKDLPFNFCSMTAYSKFPLNFVDAREDGVVGVESAGEIEKILEQRKRGGFGHRIRNLLSFLKLPFFG